MSSLKNLALQKNSFSGSVPAAWGVNAANQSRFSQLTFLNIQPGDHNHPELGGYAILQFTPTVFM